MYINLVRIYRQLMNYLAFREEPEKYTVCYVETGNLWWIKRNLHELRFFYNDFSFRMNDEVYNVRKLVDSNYQIHMRIYRDGRVTGHFELRTEHPTDHLKGIGFRALSKDEKNNIIDIFKNIEVLK